MMSSPVTNLMAFAPNALHLAIIAVLALITVRALRAATNRIVRPAGTASRAAQAREQQTRELADQAYRAGSKGIWLIASLSALPEFGITAWPAALICTAIIGGLALGSQAMIRDAIAGFHIVLEDQFTAGEMIQVGETAGRVEQFTWRRTLLRDMRGALVTIANGDSRQVSNLSRDWSQGFVDVTLPGGMGLEKPLQALETAAAELRSDAAWSQALVDGPRVLGVQSYSPAEMTLRIQLRTAPARQEEVCRELRRRIHLEFQKQGITGATERVVDTAAARLT